MDVERRPESRTVVLDGWRFHYLDWGGDGFPLLCLHGAGGDARAWEAVGSDLSRHFRVLALDQRGHGKTEAPEPPTALIHMAQDVAWFAEALKLERFHLLGHSMGARVAVAFAAGHPGFVDHLVLSDPPYYPEEDYMAAEWESLKTRPEKFPEERELLKAMMATFGDLSGSWARVLCPTLLLHGTHSKALSAEVARRLAAAMPNATLMEIEAGHGIFRENPKAALEAARTFLDIG